jgi:pimeloyl-ACP methyl ester carboxylesterase
MTNKQPMRHLLIFLPGIMGSQLQKGGRDIWTLSKIPFWQVLKAAISAGSIADLALRDDDWQHELNDGVVATNLIADLHAIPRVVTQAGYGPFYERIKSFFDVTEGSIQHPTDQANFFLFPYDWRRDNRATARKLGTFIEQQLPRWRAHSGQADAQVILIGHSMGGLIARYYVEVLEGWRTALALITIGTPHWGSVDAVESICNGKKIGLSDFTSVVRSLTSTHQLLPVYQTLQLENGSTVRIGEADVPNLDRARAAAARHDFHEVIWDHARANRANPAYQTQTIPWVGVAQDTLLSVARNNGQVQTSFSLPRGFDGQTGDGDGTVPRFAAIPPELKPTDARFAVEQHGWLTNTIQTIDPVLHTIVTLASGLPIAHLGNEKPVPAINLRVNPLVSAADGPQIRVQLAGPGGTKRQLAVTVARVDTPSAPIKTLVTALAAQSVEVALPHLDPGLYRVQVTAAHSAKNAPGAINSVFEIAEDLEIDAG